MLSKDEIFQAYVGISIGSDDSVYAMMKKVQDMKLPCWLEDIIVEGIYLELRKTQEEYFAIQAKDNNHNPYPLCKFER